MRLLSIELLLALIPAACAAPRPPAPSVTEFGIESGFGAESDWVRPYLEASARVLVRLMDDPEVAPPRTIDVTLVKDPDAEALRGGAGPTAIAFTSDRWPKEAFRLWILTHELTNLFAAHYGGHGGFPSDWWSDGRSPFPVYVTGLVLKELGYADEAAWLRSSNAEQPDHELYWALDERFGFGLFARTLRLLREDDIDLGEIEPPWPHPNRVRSTYTIAYLSMAAGENLTRTVLSFGIGKKPGGWDEVHPEIPFEEYTVSADEVDAILRARGRIPDRAREGQRPTVSESAPSKPPLLERLALHRPELRAWAMYDWANSAFYTVVITAVFPVYFKRVAAADLSDDAVRHRFGLVTTVCMTIAAVMGPILGAVADYARMKKALFTIFFLLGVLATGSLFFVPRGEWMAAAALFGVANIGIASSLVFYDAMLSHIAREGEADRLSTTGYAVGYLGGGLCLAIAVLLITFGHSLGISSEPDGEIGGTGLTARLGFVLVAVWWLVFTIPYLRRVPEPPASIEPDERAGQNAFLVAFSRIGETLKELKAYRHALLMMLAFLAYSDGIGTIIRMAAIYAAELKIPDKVTVGCILLVQFVGIPFAVLFGKIADKIGAKRAILIALAGYIGICIWASRVTEAWQFVAMGIMIGMVQGGAQALSRSLFSSLVPKHKSGEFFGLFSTLEKFAGILGPWVFSVSATSRSAILSIVVFFVVGGVLLLFVDVEAGRRTAERADASTG